MLPPAVLLEVALPTALFKDFVLLLLLLWVFEEYFVVAVVVVLAKEVLMLFVEELGCLHPFVVKEFVQETQYTQVVLKLLAAEAGIDTGAEVEVIFLLLLLLLWLLLLFICIAVIGSEARREEFIIVMADEWAKVGGESVDLTLLYFV